jgi:hypothetical protein
LQPRGLVEVDLRDVELLAARRCRTLKNGFGPAAFVPKEW